MKLPGASAAEVLLVATFAVAGCAGPKPTDAQLVRRLPAIRAGLECLIKADSTVWRMHRKLLRDGDTLGAQQILSRADRFCDHWDIQSRVFIATLPRPRYIEGRTVYFPAWTNWQECHAEKGYMYTPGALPDEFGFGDNGCPAPHRKFLHVDGPWYVYEQEGYPPDH